jgi:hypothetical protein
MVAVSRLADNETTLLVALRRECSRVMATGDDGSSGRLVRSVNLRIRGIRRRCHEQSDSARKRAT